MRKMRLFALLILTVIFLNTKGQTLDYSYRDWRNIPSEVFSNKTTCKTLDLSGNPLAELPIAILELKALRKIILNDISSLNVHKTFELLSEIDSLESIEWNNSRLLYIPSSVSQFKNLHSLELNNNCISKLPELSRTSGIEYLSLKENLLDTIREEILSFPKVTAINLSHCPAINNEESIKSLSKLTLLNKLWAQGVQYPKFIFENLKLSSLDISHGSFKELELDKTTSLSYLAIAHCDNIKLSSCFDSFSGIKNLKHLVIGGIQVDTIPYNIGQFRSLKTLWIQDSRIRKASSSLRSVKIDTLLLRNCSLYGTSELFTHCPNAAIILDDIQLDNMAVKQLKQGDHSGIFLNSTDLGPSQEFKAKNVEYLEDWEKSKAFKGFLKISKSISPSLSFSSNKQSTNTIKRTIYPAVGDLFIENDFQFIIPRDAFLHKDGKVVESDVRLEIENLLSNKQILNSGMKMRKKGNELVAPLAMVRISASSNGEEVFLDQSKSIKISYKGDDLNESSFLLFDKRKNYFQALPTEHLYARPKKEGRKNQLCQVEELPNSNFNVVKSKVSFRIKRNKRKQKMTIEMTPEYGFRRSFFQLFGDKVKGYPELKRYKNLKWKYLGDSLENDLKRLYAMSVGADLNKLEKKSTLVFDVINIDDILISTHPSKDLYVINVIHGNDTLQLSALPQLKLRKPKKIQKWHSKRFRKYKKALSKRKTYWTKLDSLKKRSSLKSEEDMEKFRTKWLGSMTESAPSAKLEKPRTNHLASSEIQKLNSIIAFSKRKYITDPITEQKYDFILPSGRSIKPKQVFVFNKDHELRYWVKSNKIPLLNSGTNYVFTQEKRRWYKVKVGEKLKLKLEPVNE